MNRRNFLGGLMGAAGAISWQPVTQIFAQTPQAPAVAGAAQATQIARGIVFHDTDKTGKRSTLSKGVANIAISNGRDVVATNAQGEYEIPVRIDDIVFVIKPSGWAPPLNAQNLPQFSYAHKPNGSPKFKYKGFKPTGALPVSLDFALVPQTENEQFRVLLFGDPQPRNLKEIDYTMRDILDELQGVDAAFGLSLGDVMFNNLQFYDELNEEFRHAGFALLSHAGQPRYELRFARRRPFGRNFQEASTALRRMLSTTAKRIF